MDYSTNLLSCKSGILPSLLLLAKFYGLCINTIVDFYVILIISVFRHCDCHDLCIRTTDICSISGFTALFQLAGEDGDSDGDEYGDDGDDDEHLHECEALGATLLELLLTELKVVFHVPHLAT